MSWPDYKLEKERIRFMFWKKKKEKPLDTFLITDENFDALVSRSELPVLVDFWAPWCGPCQVMGPIIDELATEFKDRVVIGKINVDQNPNISAHLKIKSIPTLIFVKDGQLIERISKLVPKPNLEEMLEDLIVLEVPPIEKPPASEEE